MVDKLTRQAQRQVGRGGSEVVRAEARRARRRPGPRRKPGAPSLAECEVIRSRRPAGKPMTLDEAAAEVLAREEGFLVFRDARSERVQVLFRRKDGNLGLIEPEA